MFRFWIIEETTLLTKTTCNLLRIHRGRGLEFGHKLGILEGELVRNGIEIVNFTEIGTHSLDVSS